jgi:hypothetical protein
VNTCHQLLQKQKARDKSIRDLVEAMNNAYQFILDRAKSERTSDLLSRLEKQTVECAFFVRAYVEQGMGEPWLPFNSGIR